MVSRSGSIQYAIILLGPWNPTKSITLAKGVSPFRKRFIALIEEVIDERIRERFSNALQIPRRSVSNTLIEAFWPPREKLEEDGLISPPQPRFNVMSYIGLAWLSIILDPYPSGSILEAEFTRHAGVPTVFVRIGKENCFISLFQDRCSDDAWLSPTTEMLYTFTGTSYVTVIMSYRLAKMLATSSIEGSVKDEVISFYNVFKEALWELANQIEKRMNVYTKLRRMRDNCFKSDECKALLESI